MFCNNCGYELRDGETVCPNCGNTLSVASSSSGTRLKSTFGGAKSPVDINAPYGYDNPPENAYASTPGSSYSSDLTPPGTYNPSSMDSGSYSEGGYSGSGYSSTGYSGSGYSSGDSYSSGYGSPTPPPTASPYDYSTPRSYAPAVTGKYTVARIVIAALLMIAVCFFPIVNGDQNTCLEAIEPSFESLGEIIENADEFFENASSTLIIVILGIDIGVLLSFFAAIGVLIGALMQNKKMAGSIAVVGILGVICIFVAMFTAAAEADASVFEGLEYGFWVIAGLYITSCALAIEK